MGTAGSRALSLVVNDLVVSKRPDLLIVEVGPKKQRNTEHHWVVHVVFDVFCSFTLVLLRGLGSISDCLKEM